MNKTAGEGEQEEGRNKEGRLNKEENVCHNTHARRRKKISFPAL